MRLISFNPAMLAAVRAGQKTVTRRRFAPELPVQQEPGRYSCQAVTGGIALFADFRTAAAPLLPVACPFGQPGELLRVQEDPTITLEIRSIRAEQVQHITGEDACAEGIHSVETGGLLQWGGVEPVPDAPGAFRWYTSPVAAFQGLFTSIYPTAWARNEWVWVVEFIRLPSCGSG